MGNRNVEAAAKKAGEKLPYSYHMTIGEFEQIMKIVQEQKRGDLMAAINTAFKFGVAVGSRAHAAGKIPVL